MSDEPQLTTADMLEIYASGGNGAEYVDGVGLILNAAAELRTTQAELALNLTIRGPFRRGDRVRKVRGSSWQGRVVGWYSTSLTPVGVCVESEREPGSVQIYPASALELVP